jgi:hypothetical protein
MPSAWLKERKVSREVERWKGVSKDNEEAGKFCLVNERQVLTENGWCHV